MPDTRRKGCYLWHAFHRCCGARWRQVSSVVFVSPSIRIPTAAIAIGMGMRGPMMSRGGPCALRRRLTDDGHLRETLQSLSLICQCTRGRNLDERRDRNEGEKGSHGTSRSAWPLQPWLQTMSLVTISGSTDLASEVAETASPNSGVPRVHQGSGCRFQTGRYGACVPWHRPIFPRHRPPVTLRVGANLVRWVGLPPSPSEVARDPGCPCPLRRENG